MSLQGKRVLVLGGSLFMGPPTISMLLEAGAEVTVMNRGVSPPAASLDLSGVTTVKCDRQSDAFPEFLRSSGSWDAIVDYIAYKVEDVQPLIAELGAAKIGHYVYISSDSTYMGSDPAKFVREEGRLLEQSTVRPTDAAFAKLRHDSDNYVSTVPLPEAPLPPPPRTPPARANLISRDVSERLLVLIGLEQTLYRGISRRAAWSTRKYTSTP